MTPATSILGRLLALGVLALLAGCAGRAPLPEGVPQLNLPLQLHVQRLLAGDLREDQLLVIQRDGAALRFSLLSPLGVPQSRQRLADGRWHADGLLPPNPQARELFAALLFALTPASELSRRYSSAGLAGEQRWLPGHWRAQVGERQLVLDMGEGLTYRVAPLADGAAFR